MSQIYGILNMQDNERAFVGAIGQDLVFDAISTIMADYNEELRRAVATFIDRETSDHQFRHLLPGVGWLQEMGRQAPAGAIKRSGYYDVALQLRQWGAVLGGSRVDLAYMSLRELDAHLDTIIASDLDVMRRRILTAIFENTNLTWQDPLHGNLTIRRLANQDGTLYPPVVGTQVEAQDNHYLNAGYTVAAIAAANNPVPTLRDEIAEHYGGLGSTGRNFVYFHGADQTGYLTAIAGYTAITDRYIQAADTVNETFGWPDVPGRVHGRGWGAWLSEWDGWIPDTYGLMVLLEVPAPLYMRVDPADTGLGTGLQLVSTDRIHPLQGANYEHRFGLGCVNRLAAATMLIDESSVYTPPAAYAE